MKKIISYFVNKPLTVNFIFILVMIAGGYTLMTIQREGFPRVDFDEIRITTQYPGASPSDVELNVTVKLEEALDEIDGIKRYTSISKENISYIKILLDPDHYDKEGTKADIRRCIDNVTDLPAEVTKRPNIFERKIENFPIIETILTASNIPEMELRTHARVLKKYLQDISGVAGVDEMGIRDREVQIKIDLDKLNARFLTLDDVVHAIKLHNISVTAGTLESYTSEKTIVTLSKFVNPLDVKDVIVRSNPEGVKIRIKDIATVTDTFAERTSIYRYNGKRGMSLWVHKKSSADIIRTVNKIKSAVAEYQKSIGDTDIGFMFLHDFSKLTRQRLRIVQNNALLGFFLVLVSLFFFLDLRPAIWTALGLPFSIAAAIACMPFFGITINSVSLMGIIIVIGMVVDDAIIVGENIHRHELKGLSSVDAARRGTIEVAKPVLTTISTTIIAFLPLLAIKGVVGKFSTSIPIIVTATLIGSLIEAFIILPNHMSHKSPARQTSAKTKHAGASLPMKKKHHFFNVLSDYYETLLRSALKKNVFIVIIFFIVLALVGTYLYKTFTNNFSLFPDEGAEEIYIHGETRLGTSLEKTADAVRIIEKVLTTLPDGMILNYKTAVGGGLHGEYNNNNTFALYISIPAIHDRKYRIRSVRPNGSPWRMSYTNSHGKTNHLLYATSCLLRRRKDTADDVMRILRTSLTNKQIFTNLSMYKDAGGPPLGAPIEVTIIGNDSTMSRDITQRVIKYLSEMPGVTDIKSSAQTGKDEIHLRLDYDQMAAMKLNAATIAQNIRIAFDGTVVTYLDTPEERIAYRVLLNDKYRRHKETLSKLRVRTRHFHPAPLSSVIKQSEAEGPADILHYNGDRSITVTAQINKSDAAEKSGKTVSAAEVFTALRTYFREFAKDYPGFRLIIGGEAEETNDTMLSFLFTFLIAVLAIYFLLVMLFRSFTQPVLVVSAIPFGMIGVALAFYVHNIQFGALAIMGVIGLAGVVVNDSLVMVDFINRVKIKKGTGLKENIVRGAKMRLRPILLTTITTVAGLLPTAYGIGGHDPFIISMAMALMWGLIFATLLTLLLLPCLLSIITDIRTYYQESTKTIQIVLPLGIVLTTASFYIFIAPLLISMAQQTALTMPFVEAFLIFIVVLLGSMSLFAVSITATMGLDTIIPKQETTTDHIDV